MSRVHEVQDFYVVLDEDKRDMPLMIKIILFRTIVVLAT